MITGYASNNGRLAEVPANPQELAALVWIDLVAPRPEEEALLEGALSLDLPTREEMREIEQTSRLYSENGAQFMTALIPAQTDDDEPVIEPVTFVLQDRQLVTIRYHTPRAFDLFLQRSAKGQLTSGSGEEVMIGLLEMIVDRLADVLERAGHDLEAVARRIFARDGAKARRGMDWQAMLSEIGRKGALVSTIRDSLGTLDRLIVFLGQRLRADGAAPGLNDRLHDLASDVRSLSDHAGFVAQKVTFLLDAALGLIGIEQNGIIKIFSVVSVVFLPPTLVASIYGMNFSVMPELSWPWGYPAALGVMVLSALLPYLLFRAKGWL
jgi:magnesium transporter